MKKTYIAAIILVLALGFLFTGKNNKVEAPTKTTQNESTSMVERIHCCREKFSLRASLITVKGDRVK